MESIKNLDRDWVTVPEAGKALGLGYSASYAAAKRGDFETVKIGKRLIVPTVALRRILQIDGQPNTPRAA